MDRSQQFVNCFLTRRGANSIAVESATKLAPILTRLVHFSTGEPRLVHLYPYSGEKCTRRR
jgi:hypothetical protein